MEPVPGSYDSGGHTCDDRRCTHAPRSLCACGGAVLSPFLDGYCCSAWLRKQQDLALSSLLWTVYTGGPCAPVAWEGSNEEKGVNTVKLLGNAGIYTTDEGPIRET